ncbi:MAG: hypothetical protein GF364_19495 [Candidatus Lokiarchaeota archaeon]|nr:hypothetical protein [Candidatus Lokiarchaeota archaeon]
MKFHHKRSPISCGPNPALVGSIQMGISCRKSDTRIDGNNATEITLRGLTRKLKIREIPIKIDVK